MAFFNKKVKELAMQTPNNDLRTMYQKTEEDLKYASFCGDKRDLKQVMKQHKNIECAMLYQNTPQFKRKVRRELRKKK